MRINIDFSVIIIHFSGEYLKQRGLAATVSTQNSNAFSLLNVKGQSFQKVLTDDKELCQIFYLYINHDLSPTRSKRISALPGCTAGLASGA